MIEARDLVKRYGSTMAVNDLSFSIRRPQLCQVQRLPKAELGSWPTQAGSQLTSVYHSAHTLQPWPGFGVICLFVAIVYAIAQALLDRRDA